MGDTSSKEDRHWWALARVQGLAIMAAGVAMLFNPTTAPAALAVITYGAGWGSGGLSSKLARTSASKPR